MAGNSIITPGYDEPTAVPEEVTPTELYLLKANRLKEYDNDEDSALVRRYLRVPSSSSVYSKSDVDTSISKAVKSSLEEHLNTEDPHGILQLVEGKVKKINWIVKNDGSVAFKAPQKGVDPIGDDHLTTKRFVNREITKHLGVDDPHGIIDKVKTILKEYLKSSDVYAKSQLYTKSDIDQKFAGYVKKDGSIPFTSPQISVDPTGDMHLANKRYVDNSMKKHLVSVDPHGFLTILNQRLASYAKAEDYLDRTETYSRTEIDRIITKIVDELVSATLSGYKEDVNSKFDKISKANYVKADGTVAFTAPQPGVEAKKDSHLVPLGQLNLKITELTEQLKKEQCFWITSGPVETTVGFLEDNSKVPEKMTIQEVLDAIFYGKKVSITAPEAGGIGETVEVVVCITGDLTTVELVEIFLNGKLIAVKERADFEESGCTTVESEPLDKDTEFEMKVHYSNGAEYDEYAETKLSYPIFAGIIGEWKFGNVTSFKDLETLVNRDPVNNKFYYKDARLTELVHTYNFDEKKPVKLLLALPKTYPNLKAMMNAALKFTKGAFSCINVTPYTINEKLVDYKLYIYNQPLVRLDSDITFKF